MRALVCNAYGTPDTLAIEEQPDPQPGSGEIVVDVAAAGINFPDILAIAGKYQVKTEPPFIPGNEGAGIVAAVGDGVEGFAVGDKVIFMSQGSAFAEKCKVPVATTMRMPDSLDFEQGAGFMVTYGTSYHALKQSADLKAAESLLVLGAAGGVGITAVEIGKAMGAHVIAAASSDEKLEFARAAGADETINYSDVPLKETVKEMTGGKGVDVIYDPVGGELAEQAVRALAWHGRYLVIGFACGDIPKFPANIALLKEASIIGVWWGTWAMKNPKLQVQNMMEVAQLIGDGVLTPRITETHALDDFRQGFAAIAERRARGKVILQMR